MSNNLEWWNKLRTPPPFALKKIEAGRLKGKSDISPMWRIQAMTEVFGPCGIGWKFVIDEKWREEASDGQIFAFAAISLYIRNGEQWSDAIPATGGSMLLEKEKSGIHSSDEGYKMAITDALGTAMKFLGVAADVYAGNMDGSKYVRPQAPAQQAPPQSQQGSKLSPDQEKYFPRIKAALDTLHGTDVAAKKEIIKHLTTFEGEGGKEVAGVEDYRKLDGKRVQILAHKLEAIAKKGNE